MSKREISSFRRGHRSEKVPHSVRLTKEGLKLFGQFLYGNNTFQKGASLTCIFGWCQSSLRPTSGSLFRLSQQMRRQIAKYGAKKTFHLMELALFIFRLRVLLCRLVKHQTKSSWLGNCQQSPLFCCIALFYHCPKVGPMHLECHMCLPKGQVHTFSHTILTTKLIEPFKHPFYIFCLTFLRNRFIVQITSSL